MSPTLQRVWLALALVGAVSCGRPPGVPEQTSTTQRVPFDREPRPGGISPSQSVVPSNARVAEGTTLVVRLGKALSSGSARPGDRFEGVLDDPVVVEQQTLLAQGTEVSGRVLDAKRGSGPQNPGYLRITLMSIRNGTKTILIDTSSIFEKAGSHERPSGGISSQSSGATQEGPHASSPASNHGEVVFTPERRLAFRLAQPLDLQ